MILKGESIFNYLNNQIQFDDPSESSHWKLYHSSFKFTGTGFEGLAGFGGCDPEYKGLNKNIIKLDHHFISHMMALSNIN